MTQKFLNDIDVDGFIKFLTQNAGENTGKFLVYGSDKKISFRTAEELRSDIDLIVFENPNATYDVDGKLVRIDYDNDKYKEFTYDTEGRLNEIDVNGVYVKVISYDAEGRWTSTQKTIL